MLRLVCIDECRIRGYILIYFQSDLDLDTKYINIYNRMVFIGAQWYHTGHCNKKYIKIPLKFDGLTHFYFHFSWLECWDG